jgi:hypothetical protein
MQYKESDADRFWAKVDKSSECWLWTASRKPNGYGQFMMWPKLRYAHRVAYELTVGPVPSGTDLDHVCHSRACVNPAHLRLTTRKQNLENHSGAPKNNSSGVRGVYWHKQRSKWHARVGHAGKTYNAGLFATIAEAESAVIAKRNELFTHNDLDRVAA